MALGSSGRNRRRETLEQFRRDESGKLVYTGTQLSFREGILSRDSFRLRLGLYAAGSAAAVLAAGCFPSAGMRSGFLIVLPYLFSLFLVFLTALKCIRLVFGGDPLREYVYEETVLQIPVFALLAAAACGLSVLCQLLYVLIHGFEEHTAATLVFLLAEIAAGIVWIPARSLLLRQAWDVVRAK